MDKLEPTTVTWAFVVGVDWRGMPHIVDHDDVHLVQAKRLVSVDDIYAACSIAAAWPHYERTEAGHATYTTAFLVFQLPDGHIAASPNVFYEVIPMDYPSSNHIKGAFNVLQGQIISQNAASLAAPLAAQATLSVLTTKAPDPEADKKSKGGLLVA